MSTPATNAPTRGDGAAERKRPEHITWDEQTIAEHDLLRGTRMKIDEPKTPYEHRVLSDDEDVDMTSPREGADTTTGEGGGGAGGAMFAGVAMGDLQARLSDAVAMKSRWDSDSEDEDEEAKRAAAEKKKRFEAARKAHYNEFERLKAWKAAHKDDEDDDEDDDDDSDEGAEE